MNQYPEQFARDTIDMMLKASGWRVQSKNHFNLGASTGVAVRVYTRLVGIADYVLFLNKQQIVLEIASRLSVCEKIEETITNGLQQAEALRQSILKKAFEGRLLND